ncbi:uncharacterized protein METZ01_LOCUS272533, partial [marine metagenome]
VKVALFETGFRHDFLDFKRDTERKLGHIRRQEITQCIKHFAGGPLTGLKIPPDSDSQDQMDKRVVSMPVSNQITLPWHPPGPNTTFGEYPGLQRRPVHCRGQFFQVDSPGKIGRVFNKNMRHGRRPSLIQPGTPRWLHRALC